MMNIGILCVQGAFAEHARALGLLGARTFELRRRKDLEAPLDGIVLPGGESTVMGKLINELDMAGTLREYIQSGMPVFGTCAGMILLAKRISGGETAKLATMDITVRRNAYGRQRASLTASARFGETEGVPMVFIRAPYIESASDGVEVLAAVDGKIVAARQRNQLAVSFHPELTESTVVHNYFLSMVSAYKARR